jgi:hypothetical protein
MTPASPDGPPLFFLSRWTLAVLALSMACSALRATEPEGAARFHKEIEPILQRSCMGCHNADRNKGGVAFDHFASDTALVEDRELWWKALKMLRAGLMPPKNKPRPTTDEIGHIEAWIKSVPFQIDPNNPDPGRVTVRRLNRIEYRNTVRDLLGVDYDTEAFPPDDTGFGFDNIGDVLSLSPLLLEKYITAARAIIEQAVPMAPTAVAEKRLAGRRFRTVESTAVGAGGDGPLVLSYYKPAKVTAPLRTQFAGHYQLVLDLTANERFVDGVFDYNKCHFIFRADGEQLLAKEFMRQGGKSFHFSFDRQWQAGDHELTIELQPLTPGAKQVRSLTLRLDGVTVRGPLEKEHWVRPPNYERYFPRPVPASLADRRQYAEELLRRFATRAFRRSVDDATVNRLAGMAERVYTRPGQTFEAGVAQAMTVVLASPHFLFREEEVESGPANLHPLLDEYALALRLSYFLWSSMPDEELFRLAGAHQLRKNLHAQVARMLASRRSGEFVRHFTGQWLQARDIDTVEINARAVMQRDEPPDPAVRKRFSRFRELVRKPPESLTDKEKKELADMRANFISSFRRFARFELNYGLRQAMHQETELLFDHILRQDRSVLELLDSDYTFLNERLANHYGISNVKGDQMRLVQLPPDSPRGGVLTQGTVLAVTSNPDRTSPVKRGLFILDNILGVPPPPPPPNIPLLEDAETAAGTKPPTLREALRIHRGQTLCSSCHNRMDPLGLAFENFNALGRWRDKERSQAIDAAGTLITGESFTGVRQLKHILVSRHSREFYRCLTEKVLTYALGRGLDYYDVYTVDAMVQRLEQADGHPSVLLMGIIDSAPFQRRRAAGAAETASASP